MIVTQEDGQNLYLWFQDGRGNVDYRNHSSVLLRYDGTVHQSTGFAFQNQDFHSHWFNQNQTPLATINIKYSENHLKKIGLESEQLNISIGLENPTPRSGENISFPLGFNISDKPDGVFER